MNLDEIKQGIASLTPKGQSECDGLPHPQVFTDKDASLREPPSPRTAMRIKLHMLRIAFTALFIAATPTHAGGRYPMYITRIHGDVQIRSAEPGGRWQKAKLGMLLGGPYLLRTGPHSYAHLSGKFRCVDSGSLIRIHFDSEASIEVLRGQMSAVDGKRGRSLPDKLE
jgi:hypothetical protein